MKHNFLAKSMLLVYNRAREQCRRKADELQFLPAGGAYYVAHI